MKVIDVSNYDYDIDVQHPDEWVPAFKAEGIGGIIIGTQWMEKAHWQLEHVRAGGLRVVACYAEPDKVGVPDTIHLAKDAGTRTVIVVVEPGGVQDWNTFRDDVIAIKGAGMRPVVYGNHGDVTALLNPVDFPDVPLWLASYYDDRRVIRSVDWWPKLWGHQFTSTWYIAGKNRDVSEVFEVDEPMTMAERVLIVRANDPDYTKIIENYDRLVAAGYLAPLPALPDDAAGALNGMMLRTRGIMWLAGSDAAENAAQLFM